MLFLYAPKYSSCLAHLWTTGAESNLLQIEMIFQIKKISNRIKAKKNNEDVDRLVLFENAMWDSTISPNLVQKINSRGR
jgi:hypothetical protein